MTSPTAEPPTEAFRASAALPPVPSFGEQIRRGVEGFAELTRFCMRVLRELPTAVRLYPSEIFNQAGILIRGSGLVVVFLGIVLALQSGVGGHFIFSNPGLNSYAAATYSVAILRGLLEVIFGWIVAAKICCGIVAEIGSMRISEEIDALEVMGVDPIQRLIAASVVATLFVSIVGVAGIMGGWVFAVGVQNGTSGAYFSSLNALAQLPDLCLSLAKAALFGFTVAAVACYKGYTAKGGPEGVGDAVQASVVTSFLLLFLQSFLVTTLYFNLVPHKL